MRVLAAVLATAAWLSAGACGPQGPTEQALYGTWRGDQAGQRITFNFQSDRRCELRFEDTKTGEVTVWRGKFETNFSKSPVPLSIRNIPELEYSLHTVVRFESDGHLIVAPFAPRWRLRAIAFDPERSMRLARARDGKS